MNLDSTVQPELLQSDRTTNGSFRTALILAGFTIVYNIVEGLVSIFFGVSDENFTLLGFGTDSFIEVLSGIGIAHMILRTRRNPASSRDGFEQSALRITGVAFYILVVGLVSSAAYNTWVGHRPEIRCRSCYLLSLDFDNVGTDESKTAHGTETEFTCHNSGCGMHKGLCLHVRDFACRKRVVHARSDSAP